MRAAALLTVLFAPLSCSLLVSTTDLSAGTDTATDAPLDGAVDTNDSETSTTDARATGCGDGGKVLCDEFERESGLGPWTRAQTVDEGSITISGDDARPGNRVLRAQIDPASKSGSAAFVFENGPMPTKRALYRFALRIIAAPKDGESGAQLNTLSFRVGPDNYNIYIHMQSYGVHVSEQSFPNGSGATGMYRQHVIARLKEGGPWQDLALEVRFDTTVPRIILREGSTTLLDVASETGLRRGTVTAIAGINFVGSPHGRLEALVDDCALDVE